MATFASRSTSDIKASIRNMRSVARHRQHCHPTASHNTGDKTSAGRVMPGQSGGV
jgi:hypothetical protein